MNSLQLYFGNVSDKDLCNNLGKDSGDSLQLALIDEGTVMMTLNTKNSLIDLEAEKFNEYLKEEGLTEAIEYRQKSGDTIKNGHENYQRSVKTIFQVGKRFTNVCKQKTDLPLDIIPVEHPYTIVKDESDFSILALKKNLSA